MSSKIRTIKKALNFRLLSQIFMKKFSFPKNMVRTDVFRQVLWQFLSARWSRIFRISRVDFLAACGGEIGSNYFKNTA